MALLERLQILIDADAKGAVREFDKAGAAADRLDAKLEKGAEKTAARLTSIGTKAAIGGTVVLGGLFKLAQASDEAEQQQLKLENSIKNSDKAFRNGGKALTELATGLQQVTAADGDAIVGAQSLLVQFGLTEDQVKKVTPLVVDLSRKLGIDLDGAAKMVGKSIGGSAGALKKAGIDIDATRLKTDAFGATVDALSSSVQGFAVAEGKTFSGQLQILRNNLGDLGETVGKGAAGVFSDLAGGANDALGALNQLNPALGESVGRVGAVGGIAVTAVGGLAVLAGQFQNVKTAAFNAEGGLTRFGKAAAGIGIAAGVLAIVQVAQAIDSAKTSSFEFEKAVGDLGNAKGAQELGKAFKAAEQESKSLLDTLASIGPEDLFFDQRVSVEGFDIGLSDVKRTLEDLSNSGNITALSNAIAVLENNTTGSADNLAYLRGELKRYKQQVKDSAGATAAATVAQRNQNKAVQDAVDAYDAENATLESIQKTLGDYEKKIRSLDDAYEVAQTGAKAFGDSIEQSTTLDDVAIATVNLSEKLRTVGADLSQLPANFQDAFDVNKITAGSGAAVTALVDIGNAVKAQFGSLIAGGNEALIPRLAAQYRDTVTKALQAAGIPPDQIKQYLGLAGLNEEQIELALKITQVEEELAKLKQRIAIFQVDLDNAPQEVRVAVDQALLEGNIAEANRIIDEQVVKSKTVQVFIQPTEPGFVGPIAPGSPGYGTAPQTQPRNGQSRYATAPAGTKPASNFLSGGGIAGKGGLTYFRGFPAGVNPNTYLPWVDKNGKVAGWLSQTDNRWIPKRALGGPLAKGQRSFVNEMGAEMFVPTSSGFVMDSDDSKALVRGVEAMLAGGGGNTFNITTSDPQLVATEVVRKQRDAAYLIGR